MAPMCKVASTQQTDVDSGEEVAGIHVVVFAADEEVALDRMKTVAKTTHPHQEDVVATVGVLITITGATLALPSKTGEAGNSTWRVRESTSSKETRVTEAEAVRHVDLSTAATMDHLPAVTTMVATMVTNRDHQEERPGVIDAEVEVEEAIVEAEDVDKMTATIQKVRAAVTPSSLSHHPLVLRQKKTKLRPPAP